MAYSYVLMDNNNEIVETGEVSSALKRVNDLKPFQNYSFSVSSVTEKGSGPSSDEVAVATKEAG